MNQKQSGSRTLMWSVILSSPGPLVVGLGLLAGRSSTQIADFFRRSTELLAIIMSFVVYRLTTREDLQDIQRKKRLERISNRFVGAMMCLSGFFMVFLALFSETEDKGNVIPGLTIAILGVIANTIFLSGMCGTIMRTSTPRFAAKTNAVIISLSMTRYGVDI